MKIILATALLTLATSAMAQKSEFCLKADIEDLSDDTVLVYKGRGVKMDTVLIKNNKFVYKTKLDAPVQYSFINPATYRGHQHRVVDLVCVPGEQAEIVGSAVDRYDITGSKYYKQYHEVDLFLEKVYKPYVEFRNDVTTQVARGANRDEVMKKNSAKLEDMMKKTHEEVIAFAAQHPDYESCTTLVTNFSEVGDMEKLIASLSEKVRNGRMKAYYQPIIDHAKARVEQEEKAKKVQASGMEAPDFTLKDINGKDLSLSSLRGKYVVLDFWGSWCIWCIKGMPKMKEYYEKYKGKFEILGVDCNDTEAKWKAAVEKHQLPLLHVYNPKGSDVLSKYAIQGFPTKIVVGPDGKIVKTIVGEDPAFYTLLDDMLK